MLVVAIVGLGTSIYGFVEYETAKIALSWPTTVGKVYKSEVKRRGPDSEGSYSYDAVIRYAYQVNNRRYSSGRVYFGADFRNSSPDYPRELVAAFPMNSTPVVYYQRNNPNEAVLLPGPNKSVYGILMVGLMLFLSGIAATIYLVKQENKHA